MITETLKKWESFDFTRFFESVGEEEVRRVLGKEVLSERDLLVLLSAKADEYLEEMAGRAAEITERQFGRTINLYTPLYISDFCANHCLYCGFNSRHDLRRRKLSAEELRIEGERIAATGLQHILLLTGGDREETPPSYIAGAVEILKPLFASISIEVYALTEGEYAYLVGGGVNNVTIYQETYDRKLYKKLHLSGEKADYDFRAGAPERAAAAGVHSVNLGVLLGLGEPAVDFFMACLHADLIRKNFPSVSVAMSFPRIRPAAGGFKALHPIFDRDLVRFVTAFRIFCHRGEISLSTRESVEFRNGLLPLGVTRMSAQSRTSVVDEGNEQFAVNDERTVLEMDRDLRSMGFQPVYRDWVRV